MRLIFFPLFLVAIISSYAQLSRVYTSPDRSEKAVVLTSPKGESRVEIRAMPDGRVLLVRDETSCDGSSGRPVSRAVWTPDSQFFVVGTEASGGHQPWARPIWVYSRVRNRVFELEKMGATPVGDFKLDPPDVIHVDVPDCGAGRGDLQPRRLVFSLHELVAAGRLPNAPCPAK